MASLGGDKEVKIVISAEDNTSSALNSADTNVKKLGTSSSQLQSKLDQVRQSLSTEAIAAQEAASQSGAVARQWDKLTNVSEYLAGGIKKIRFTLEGILWGTVIGAVASLVSKFIEWISSSNKVETSLKDLTTTVETQAQNWGFLIPPMKGVTVATVELYKAQLLLAQLMAIEGIPKMKAEKQALEEKNKSLIAGMDTLEKVIGNEKIAGNLRDSARTQFNRLSHEFAENRVKAAEMGVELEKMDRVMGLKVPQSAETVYRSIEKMKTSTEEYGPATKAMSDAVQEALGRTIVANAQAELDEKNRAAIQEQMGRDIVAAAQREYHDKAAIQEALGTLIRDQAVRDYKLQTSSQEALGRVILANAQAQNRVLIDVYNQRNANNEALQREIDLTSALMGNYGSLAQKYALQVVAQQRLNTLQNAGSNALQSYILGQKSLGQALKEALAQTLATWAAEDAMHALRELAYGFATAFENPAASAMHFQAAALFGAAAAAEGVAGSALASSAGAGNAPLGSSLNPITTENLPQNNQQTSETPVQPINNIYIYGNLVDMDDLSRELMKNDIKLKADVI